MCFVCDYRTAMCKKDNFFTSTSNKTSNKTTNPEKYKNLTVVDWKYTSDALLPNLQKQQGQSTAARVTVQTLQVNTAHPHMGEEVRKGTPNIACPASSGQFTTGDGSSFKWSQNNSLLLLSKSTEYLLCVTNAIFRQDRLDPKVKTMAHYCQAHRHTGCLYHMCHVRRQMLDRPQTCSSVLLLT